MKDWTEAASGGRGFTVRLMRRQREPRLVGPTGNQRAPLPGEGPQLGWGSWVYLRQVHTPGDPVFSALHRALDQYRKSRAPRTLFVGSPFPPLSGPGGQRQNGNSFSAPVPILLHQVITTITSASTIHVLLSPCASALPLAFLGCQPGRATPR